MMNVKKVEGWDEKTGWHFGGFFDLDTKEGESGAKAAFIELSKLYCPVRYTRVYSLESNR